MRQACPDQMEARGPIATPKRGKRIATSINGTLTRLGGNLEFPRERGKAQPQFCFLNESLITKGQIGLLQSLV
jgi:hypothetical protein